MATDKKATTAKEQEQLDAQLQAAEAVKNPKATPVELSDADQKELDKAEKAEQERIQKVAAANAEVMLPNVTEAVEAPMKKYKVRPLVNHECVVGGFRYTFKKDHVEEVPADVCAILQNSGIVIKL